MEKINDEVKEDLQGGEEREEDDSLWKPARRRTCSLLNLNKSLVFGLIT